MAKISKSKKLLSRLKSAGSLTALGRQIWPDAAQCKDVTLRVRTARYFASCGVTIPHEYRKPGPKPMQPTLK